MYLSKLQNSFGISVEKVSGFFNRYSLSDGWKIRIGLKDGLNLRVSLLKKALKSTFSRHLFQSSTVFLRLGISLLLMLIQNNIF